MPISLHSNARAGDCSSNIFVVVLTLAWVLMATAACGGAVPTGAPPFKLDWRTSSSKVDIGESVILTIRMYDVRESGERGGISVSFPMLTESGDSDGAYTSPMADVEATNYTSGLSSVNLYGPGETIYHRDGNRMFPAESLLVESDDPSWTPSDDRTLRIRITPKSAGEFTIWIRGWICAEEYTDCSRAPVDGMATDQQGYRVGVVRVELRDSGL